MLAYSKQPWTDRAVQYPNRYAKSGESTGQVTLVADPGTVTDTGTPITANRMNHIEQGIYDTASALYPLQREVANLKAVSSIKDRTDGASGLFYDLFDELNGGSIGQLDTTKTSISGATSAGATSVTVLSVSGLSVGQEVTIFDDVNMERKVITGIAGSVVSFSALANSYKAQATLCRSSVIVDTANHLMKFGGWGYFTTYTRTNVSVVASAHDTSGNGGRKVTVLSNGWIVAVELDSSTPRLYFHVSNDNGATFSQLTYVSINASGGFAIASNGTTVYVVMARTAATGGANCSYLKFDATTVGSGPLSPSTLETGSSSDFGACSIAVAPDGSIHAAWSRKDPTLSLSFNIRYSKSTDGGATWASPTQITNYNASGDDWHRPCIICRSNNRPIIFCDRLFGTTYYIAEFYWDGSAWQLPTGSYVYAVATYVQANPCAAIAPSGRIWCAWQGRDATDTTAYNIRIKYSDDGGATWNNGGVSAEKITSGNSYSQLAPSVSVNKNGNVYIVWAGIDSAVSASHNNQRRIIWNGTSWGSISTLTSNTTASANSTSTVDNNTLDFTDPLTIYQDSQATAVKFRGSYTAGATAPVTVEDARYNIVPASNISSIVAWADRETDAGFSLSAAASIHASTESMASMTKTSATVDGSTSEDQFVLSGVTAAAKGTLRLTLTRSSTSIDKAVKQIVGAVGA